MEDGMEQTPVDCPWHPLPEDAIVQLVAIERRAVRRHRIGPPIEPARVVWGVWIQRDGTTHESYDLPLDVIRTLARDGGPIHPMIEITGLRLNAAVERAAAELEQATGGRADDPQRTGRSRLLVDPGHMAMGLAVDRPPRADGA
jgi:hypothetical protein